jgi:hypothetical protein
MNVAPTEEENEEGRTDCAALLSFGPGVRLGTRSQIRRMIVSGYHRVSSESAFNLSLL